MHYYKFNIGDYASHTQHLEPIEDIAYRRMLDWVYLHESPLPDSPEQIARLIRMRTHCEDIANVLREFFTLTDYGWMQEKASAEIDEYKEKSKKAKASAAARWAKKPTIVDANALRTECEGNANQEPLNNKDMSATPQVNQNDIDCESIFEFWKLSMGKTARTILNKDRKSKIKARLKEGYLVDEIKLAISNCSRSIWNMNNSVNDIEYICRNQQNLDKMLATTQHLANAGQPTKSDMLLAGSSTQNVFTGQPLVTMKQGFISND